VFTAVVLVHLALLYALLVRWRLTSPHALSGGSLVLLRIPPPARAEPGDDSRSAAAAAKRPRVSPAKPAERMPASPSSQRPKEADDRLTSVTPPIDWADAAARTAHSRVDAANAPESRPLDRHAPGNDMSAGLPARQAPPDFAWDHAHTQRIEPLEGGGAIIWINDRCFVPLGVFIPLPFCGIGKIPVYGDLFKHMRDSKEFEHNKNRTPGGMH
jgi:hypothetical protein